MGSHLCERLLAEGWSVVCVDSLMTGSTENLAGAFGDDRFAFQQANVSERIDVDGPVDWVLHFASPASPRDYLDHPIQTLKVGSLGTMNSLGLARAKGAGLLLASTSEVYGDPLVHPQPESYWGNVNPIGPRSRLRRGEAVRGGHRHRLPPGPWDPRQDRADLQHLRTSHARERWPGGSRVHLAGLARRADHRPRHRQPDPIAVLRRRSGGGTLEVPALRGPRPAEPREPRTRCPSSSSRSSSAR